MHNKLYKKISTPPYIDISYGHIHIPSIALREIPVQREQLRLKLSYGNKKITTFNADLCDRISKKVEKLVADILFNINKHLR